MESPHFIARESGGLQIVQEVKWGVFFLQTWWLWRLSGLTLIERFVPEGQIVKPKGGKDFRVFDDVALRIHNSGINIFS